MSEPEPSTEFSRWGAPVALVALSFALSAWLWATEPPWRLIPQTKNAVLFGLPLISLTALLGLRLLGGRAGRASDLFVTASVAFLVGVHGLIAALALGILETLTVAAPLAAGVLFFFLGLIVRGLEFRSPFGFSTRATKSSEGVWARAHARLGTAVSLGGLAAAAIAPLHGVGGLATLVVGTLVGLGLATFTAADEESTDDARPKDAP